MATSFFARDDVEQALTDLATSDRLTVFVGAGSSMEVGLPSWAVLIDRLLHRIASGDLGLSGEQVSAYREGALRESGGVLGAASIIRDHFAEPAFAGNSDDFIRQALYEGNSSTTDEIQPGPSARAIADLRPLWPEGHFEVVTTNYDLLIVNAITEQIKADSNISLTSARAARGGELITKNRFAVRHLHGALDPQGVSRREVKPVVLAEADYHEVQEGHSWQRLLLVDLLRQSPCLFVGASMTDANVLRFLRVASDEPTAHGHVALLTRTAGYLDRDPAVDAALEKSTANRWKEFGVQALYPPYYTDTAQFLAELNRRRRAHRGGRRIDDPGVRLPARLSQWETRMSATTLSTGPRKFASAQDQAHAALRDWLGIVIRRLPGRLRAQIGRETFGMQLWVSRESGSELLLWAQSTNVWRDPSTLEPIKVALGTQWGAIDAYCAGSPVLQDLPAGVGSRWAETFNVPLFLEDVGGRLPVGVLTLSIMDRHRENLLRQLTPAERIELQNLMSAAGVVYLTPPARTRARRPLAPSEIVASPRRHSLPS